MFLAKNGIGMGEWEILECNEQVATLYDLKINTLKLTGSMTIYIAPSWHRGDVVLSSTGRWSARLGLGMGHLRFEWSKRWIQGYHILGQS